MVFPPAPVKDRTAAEYVVPSEHSARSHQRESQDEVPVITPAAALPEPDLLEPLLLVTVKFLVEV
jgi:hypothetical protein